MKHKTHRPQSGLRKYFESLEIRTMLSAPANDLFANSVTLTGITANDTGTNVEATKENFEPNPAGNNGGSSVWWKWVAPKHAGKVTINTFGSNFDTILGVYKGTDFNTIFYVTANDDTGGSQSQVTFDAVADTQYNIVVDGFKPQFGIAPTGDISLSLVCPPDNDDFEKATVLTGNNVSDNDDFNGTATSQVGEPNPAAASGAHGVWWKWTSPASSVTATINTSGSDFDTTLGVYTGSAVNVLTKVVDNDDAPATTSSQVQFVAQPNTDYYILVNGKSAAAGSIHLNLQTSGAPAGAISGNFFNDKNSNATKDAGEADLSGWTAYLDTNNNSVKDGGEISATTDANGNYTFSGLAAGTYHVKQVFQSGYRKSKPAPGTQGYDVVVGGATVSGIDFGETTNILLGGTAYNDVNGNGMKDAGEVGIPGIEIDIISNGSVITTRITDANGKWKVQGLAAGSGEAVHFNPAGYVSTFPGDGKYTGSMSAGEQNQNLNFGMMLAPPAPAAALSPLVTFRKYEGLNFFTDASQ